MELTRSEVHGANENAASGGKKYSLAPKGICLETNAALLNIAKTRLSRSTLTGATFMVVVVLSTGNSRENCTLEEPSGPGIPDHADI